MKQFLTVKKCAHETNERTEHRKKIASSHVIDICMCEHARTSNKCDTKCTQL